jgi:hypothetical protein
VPLGNEGQIARAPNGSLLMNSRSTLAGVRLLSWSDDRGEHWSAPVRWDGTGSSCEGSTLLANDDVLLYSHNRGAPGCDRCNMSVWASADSGASWRSFLELDARPTVGAAYSALARLNGSHAHLIYERDGYKAIVRRTIALPTAAALLAAAEEAPPRIDRGANNMPGRIPAPKASTPAIRFLGVESALAGCEAACLALQGCTSFTWHHLDFVDRAGQCYGRLDGVWAPVPQQGIDSGLVASRPPWPPPPPPPYVPKPHGGGRCGDDDDCQLNGACRHSRCECDAAWTGANCS